MNIILMVALLVGGGASAFAEGSLPGDVLYGVKVGVNENVRGWFAVSDEAEANWSAKQAERRIEESEKLAAEGRLNAEASADLEASFESHAEAFEDRIAKLEAQGNASAAVEATSDFEASLNAHEQILARVAAERAEMRAQANSVLAKVRIVSSSVASLRAAAQAGISAEVGADIKVAAEGKLTAAENKMAEVKGYLARVRSSVSATVSAAADARLRSAEAAVVRGKASMSANAYAEAFVSFQEAIRLAQQAQLTVLGEVGLNIDLGSSGNADSNANANVNSNGTGVQGTVDVQVDL